MTLRALCRERARKWDASPKRDAAAKDGGGYRVVTRLPATYHPSLPAARAWEQTTNPALFQSENTTPVCVGRTGDTGITTQKRGIFYGILPGISENSGPIGVRTQVGNTQLE